MPWTHDLFHGQGVATAVLILALAATAGLALGSIRVYGIRLGIAGVLFAGILFGHFQLTINPQMLDFARDFGLILFVYSIGAQVGPGFLDSLRRQGLPLNLLAAGVVLLGTVIAVLIGTFGHVDMPAAIGLLSGATTNTPSLAAAQQTIREMPGASAELAARPGLGYAIAYPFGVVGIILAMLVTRLAFRIDLRKEGDALKRLHAAGAPARLTRMHLQVRSESVTGVPVKEIPMVADGQVVISRILHEGRMEIARPNLRLHPEDVILAVGAEDRLNEFRMLVGRECPIDLTSLPSEITSRRLVVTRPAVLGKAADELDLAARFGVTVTRICRAGVEFTPGPAARLQFGDTVLAVGDAEGLDQAASELGNSARQLDLPQIVPIFVGIALGVLLGSVPFHLPGIPAPVSLGLAGGPLVVAILLSRIGRVGPLIWYLPISANAMLRELGIVLFLASVGLRAGGHFVETLLQGDGFTWMGLAALITIVPLLMAAFLGRLLLKMNFLSLCGLLAGSMTDPPALAFAGAFTGSDAPSVAYATVYPLTMLLRVLLAQLALLLFMR